ncbi:MAG: DUF4252 domain-containing protein [Bacteroides sp.]|nr:DUF4252 domain-containing protein [Bacteroides sp.]
MKKLVLTTGLLLLCSMVFAQSINDIFKEFGKAFGAETSNVSPLKMRMERIFGEEDDDDTRLAKKIKSMKVMELDDCSQQVKQRFAQTMKDFTPRGYEMTSQVTNEGDTVRLLLKKKGNIIQELLIICTGREDWGLVLMKGDIQSEDLADLVHAGSDEL